MRKAPDPAARGASSAYQTRAVPCDAQPSQPNWWLPPLTGPPVEPTAVVPAPPIFLTCLLPDPQLRLQIHPGTVNIISASFFSAWIWPS